MTLAQAQQPLVFIVSGPSGSGKSTLVQKMLEVPGTMFSVSCTTRPPRATESAGKWYDFVSEEEFERRVRARASFWNTPAFSASTGTARRAGGWKRRSARAWTWCSKLTCRAPNR